MNKSVTRVANNYMKKLATSDKEEIEWSVAEIGSVLDRLQDVHLAMTAKHGRDAYEAFDSIADGSRKVGEAMARLQKVSADLDGIQRLLQAAAREKRAAKTALQSVALDAKTKRAINNRFRQEGLGEQRNFETAQKGYSKVWEVLGEFGVVVDGTINSFLFVDNSTPDGKANDGSTSLSLALKTDDPFTEIPIKNSLLVFTFHRKENGQWGVLCYVS